MVECKEDKEYRSPEELNQRFRELELHLRRLELEKSDYLRAIRHLVVPVSLALRHEGVPESLLDSIKIFEGRLNQKDISPDEIEAFSQNLQSFFSTKDIEKQTNPAYYGKIQKSFNDPDDTFFVFLKQLSSYKGVRFAEEAENIRLLLEKGTSVQGFLKSLANLLLRFLEDCREERHEISIKLSCIVRALIALETEFRSLLDKSILYLGSESRPFSKELSQRIEDIQRHIVENESDDPRQLLNWIAETMEQIASDIRRKNEMENEVVGDLSKQKASLKNSLESVSRDYDVFVKQSHQLLKQMEEIKAVALRDALTGVYNRRAYDEQIILSILNYKTGKLLTFSLLIFDIDFFRDVNNLYGHQAGDSILYHLANIVTKTLRTDDFVFRYGGDEFVVLLPAATLDSAVQVGEKIREKVNQVEFKLTRDRPDTIRISISMGVAEVRHSDTQTTILARADKALYVSKACGRNQVTREDS
ncbi:MAG: GGDEF domain-containing protein [Deltaproteobacteria bacterium]|jgi:diguanylate cyclase (GGDEF)-like protein|nr:GGDEF domain-containing protein [Deltaproteobacteria bacterium]